MASIHLKPLKDQVVVVFGASSGIGRATALLFARKGAKLVIAARRDDALETLASEIIHLGAQVVAVPADAAEYDQVKNVAEAAVHHFGRLDTWAHVAGVGLYGRFEDITPQEFRQTVEVNLLGQVYGAMAALPYLKHEGRGALIHVSSVESQIGLPFQSAYAASKHGMKGFLDVLRLELAHYEMPIAVTNIMPAVINTPFYSNAYTKLGVKPRAMSPIYQPERVAEAIVHAAYKAANRDVIVGSAGYLMVLAKRLLPSLVNAILLRTSFKGQLTSEKKTASSPSNLFASNTHDTRIHGDFSTEAAP